MTQYLYKNCRLATLSQQVSSHTYGLLDDGALAVDDGSIVWVGQASSIPDTYTSYEQIDLGGRLLTPALIDCHTHLVFGGNRANEFEMRLEGASYEQVNRAGGGIISTVKHVRGYSVDDLVDDTLPRLDTLINEGVATVEIKSGYGLTIEDELKMLRAAQILQTLRSVRIKKTFLGAHAIPPEYANNGDAYIDEVCIPALKQGHAEGLIDAVDAFCEGIAFSVAQTAKVFDVAKALNIPIKIHAEQLSNLHGTEMATSYGALSADHLEYLDENGVKAMAKSKTVAVLLPGAFYSIRETQMPPVDGFRKHGVAMAIATDCNPGSSPLNSLLLTMNMACTLFRLTPEESLNGVTVNAARALGLENQVGTLDVGKKAELAIWDVSHPAELSYRIGFNPLYKRIV